MKEKFNRVRQICGSWGLYENGESTEYAQLLKGLSEVGELADSILKNDRDQVKDDIGDILVCMINANEIETAGMYDFYENFYGDPSDESISDCVGLLTMEIGRGLCCFHWSRAAIFRSLENIAKHFSLSIEDCLDQSISEIEKRKGKIINGAFVKDAK